jgi:uncharacterized protein involved in response to NO
VALMASACTYFFVQLTRAVRAPALVPRTSPHLRFMAVASGIGIVCLWAQCGAMASAAWSVSMVLSRTALWAFVGGTFAAAAHRMIPFASGTPFDGLDRRLPSLMPYALATLLLAKACAELLDRVRPAVGVVEVVAGSAWLVFALRWTRLRTLRPAMLKMLFAGFVWLGVSSVLSGVAEVFHLPAGSAALHAFTLGFLGSTMLAMLSRFAIASAGRQVAVDRALWVAFLLLQASATARVAAPMVPASASALIPAAALAWSGVWLFWALRYGRMLWAKKPLKG